MISVYPTTGSDGLLRLPTLLLCLTKEHELGVIDLGSTPTHTDPGRPSNRHTPQTQSTREAHADRQ